MHSLTSRSDYTSDGDHRSLRSTNTSAVRVNERVGERRVKSPCEAIQQKNKWYKRTNRGKKWTVRMSTPSGSGSVMRAVTSSNSARPISIAKRLSRRASARGQPQRSNTVHSIAKSECFPARSFNLRAAHNNNDKESHKGIHFRAI